MKLVIPSEVVDVLRRVKRGDVMPRDRVVVRLGGGVVRGGEWRLWWGEPVEGTEREDLAAISLSELVEFVKLVGKDHGIVVTTNKANKYQLDLEACGKNGVPRMKDVYNWVKEDKDGVELWEQTPAKEQVELVGCEWLAGDLLTADKFTDSENTRYALTAIRVHPDGVCGSDGRRAWLGKRGSPVDMGLMKMRDLVKVVIGEGTLYGAVWDGTEDTKVVPQVQWQVMREGKLELWLRGVEGRFPDPKGYIPQVGRQDDVCNLVGVADGITKACKDAGPRVGDNGSAVWVCGGRLVVLTDQQKTGVEFEIEDMGIKGAIDPKYLMDFLDCGLVGMSQQKQDAPIRFDGDDGLGVLMPLSGSALSKVVAGANVVKWDGVSGKGKARKAKQPIRKTVVEREEVVEAPEPVVRIRLGRGLTDELRRCVGLASVLPDVDVEEAIGVLEEALEKLRSRVAVVG